MVFNHLPFSVTENVLEPAEQRALLDWTIGSEERFSPARVTDDRPLASEGVVKPELRQALICRDLVEIEPTIAAVLERHRSAILGTARHTDTSELELELEITAYGHGGHFAAHADIPTGAAAEAHPEFRRRVVSAVLYYHRLPKGFGGGDLRFRVPGISPADDMKVEPLNGRLVIFPSWLVHEVMPVQCPIGGFEDSRFAVNCWFLEKQA